MRPKVEEKEETGGLLLNQNLNNLEIFNMKLKATKRELVGKKVRQFRAEGYLPASIYGPKREAESLLVHTKEFRKLFEAVGYSTLFDIEIDGAKEPSKVLVKEVQQHVVNDKFIHVSLYEVDMNSTLHAEIPIVIEGMSPAVKNNLGLLVNTVSTVEIVCLPKDLPHQFDINISGLAQVGESITIADIQLPHGVELASSVAPETAVAYIAAPQKVVLTDEAEDGAEAKEGEEDDKDNKDSDSE